MAKKNFSDGLDEIFDSQEQLRSENIVFEQKNAVTNEVPRKKTLHKNFTSNLDTLFQEAMQESIAEHVERVQKEQPSFKQRTQVREKIRRTLHGIDALIRQTVETSEVEISPIDAHKKRVTFTLDKEKVSLLKNIAVQNRTYIKDIVSQVVSEYLSRFDNNAKA